MVLVYLVVDGVSAGRPTTRTTSRADTPVTRVSEPANYRANPDDPADRTVLCAELPCALDDDVWSASDHDLAARVSDDLARAGLPPIRPSAVGEPAARHVYPVYDVGFRTRLEELDAWAALPAVTTFGRLGLFAHDNTHHAMQMAYDAVDALDAGGTVDPAAWSAARARFATHVVED